MSNLPQITPDDQNVVITIPKSKMKDFIGDVLKTKRRIGKGYDLVYNIKKSDVMNIINVIHHRVREQSNPDLIDISIDVLFDDGSNRQYNNIDQFETIDDNLKATSVAVLISMTYLMKFNSDELPTKNEIRIAAMSSSRNLQSEDPFRTSNVHIVVETNKFTWAEDIINNFTSYLNGQFNKPNTAYKIIKKIFADKPISIIYPLISVTVIFMIMMAYFREISLIEAVQWQESASAITGNTIQSANQKLDLLISKRGEAVDLLFQGKIMLKYGLYAAAYLFIGIILPFVYLSNSNNSYVSIGRVSEIKNSERINKENFYKGTVLIGSIISITLSVSSSYIYDSIKNIIQ